MAVKSKSKEKADKTDAQRPIHPETGPTSVLTLRRPSARWGLRLDA